MEAVGLEPDPQEPIGFGPEASKEGKRVYDLSWGDPVLIFTAMCLLWLFLSAVKCISRVWDS